MPVWPSDPPVKLTPGSHLSGDKSHLVRLTTIEIGSHTGTHIDAPYHFIESGRRLNEISLDTLVGLATVFEIPAVPSIGVNEVDTLPLDGAERILFKTENSKHWADCKFYENFVYLEPAAARVLADRGVKLVGIDSVNIDDTRGGERPVHTQLLGAEVLIVEHLCNLGQLPEEGFTFSALPPKFKGAGTFPVRALAKLR